ncbi:hypothetical protein DPX16_3430 [Anabarilius grahami]|uniref:Uncharacterized protein n=1 Tax=Anabarilius grahami TaxID=495550 RepID=A0A3N0Z2V4_ANAGA|nr:hypothetical protein DPX16_3430 [Anabarilius grahami]
MWLPSLASSYIKVERAHCVNTKVSSDHAKPQVFLSKLLRFTDRELILRAARLHAPVKTSDGTMLSFFPDFSLTAKKCFVPIGREMRHPELSYSILQILKVILNQVEQKMLPFICLLPRAPASVVLRPCEVCQAAASTQQTPGAVRGRGAQSAAKPGGKDLVSGPETGDLEGEEATLRKMMTTSLSPPEEGRVENPLFRFVCVLPLALRSPAIPTSSIKELIPIPLGPKRARLVVHNTMPHHPQPPHTSPAGGSVNVEAASFVPSPIHPATLRSLTPLRSLLCRPCQLCLPQFGWSHLRDFHRHTAHGQSTCVSHVIPPSQWVVVSTGFPLGMLSQCYPSLTEWVMRNSSRLSQHKLTPFSALRCAGLLKLMLGAGRGQ